MGGHCNDSAMMWSRLSLSLSLSNLSLSNLSLSAPLIQDLTNRLTMEQKEGRKRPLEETQSFFSWFSDTDTSSTDVPAEVIKDDIWPNPLQFYLVSGVPPRVHVPCRSVLSLAPPVGVQRSKLWFKYIL